MCAFHVGNKSSQNAQVISRKHEIQTLHFFPGKKCNKFKRVTPNSAQ